MTQTDLSESIYRLDYTDPKTGKRVTREFPAKGDEGALHETRVFLLACKARPWTLVQDGVFRQITLPDELFANSADVVPSLPRERATTVDLFKHRMIE